VETGCDLITPAGERVKTSHTPIPAVQDRPKRSAAHERAIRRAWAERKDRRAAESLVRHVKAKRADAVQRAARYRIKYAQQAERAAWACAALDKAEQRRWDQWEKRRTNAERARRMIAAARHASTFERQRAAVLAAQLAKAQEDLAGAYSEAELQAAVSVERERAASLRAELEAARAEGEGRADGAGVAAAQAAAQMARAIAAEEAVAAVRADLDKERAALAAVTARNARLLQSMADLTERVERAEAAIAA
jgi:colicin import membrane protein